MDVIVPRVMNTKPGDENDEANTTSICAAAVTNTDLASAFVHYVERRDDFQEQMGMSDEENMRHCWSPPLFNRYLR